MQPCPNCGAPNADTAKFCGRCGQALTTLLTTGATLQGRYRITRLLGKGGMGAVYLAQDARLGGRMVAVKENFDASAEAQSQFQTEATTLANLIHTSLPRVSDHFIEVSGKQYLVMDYIEGEDLQEMLDRQGRLAEALVQPWFDQVCDALSYLHSQNPPVIHRDIKPSNIKVTPAGRAMLVDFGIAKQLRPGQKTAAAARAVTSGFSPPEQYGGGSTDARTDVYALAATYYCLLTGQTPPDAMDRLTQDRLTPPRQLVSSMSAQVEQAILKAMSPLPNNRLRSVQEFRTFLAGQRMAPYVAASPLVSVSPSSQAPVALRPLPAPPASIVTPSPVPTTAMYDFASVWRRLAATLIDSFILWLPFMMLAFLLVGIAEASGDPEGTLAALQCLALGLQILVFLGYYVHFYARSGQTIGKRAVGIKVIGTDGALISKKRALSRTIVYMIELFGVYFLFVGLLGFAWMVWDRNKQTWHDKAAKTYVIRT